MKYCLFSGTFNPVHNAHILMAQKVLKEFNFNKIIFIPAYMQPLKDYDYCKLTAKHRLNMLQAALKNYPEFEVNTIEYDKKDVSYTYNTILELYKTLPDIEGKINFIIGTDALINIEKWYEYEKLIQLTDFILLIRDNNDLEKCKKIKNINFKLLKSDKINISSSQIRNLVKNNEDISKLVPKEVQEYIKQNNLYTESEK